MFWFSRKATITVDCFTSKDYVYRNNPIEPSGKLMPDWVKNMPTSYKDNGFVPMGTIKKCPSIIQFMASGFIIPLWSDLAIKLNGSNNSYEWQFADNITGAEPHSFIQWQDFAHPNENTHLKLLSPWRIKTKEDINFVWMFPFYNNKIQLDYHITPAIIEFKYQHASNINMFLDTNKDKNFVISAGTPLAQLIPMSDKKIKIKTHLVSEEEYDKYSNPRTHFLNEYQKIMKSKCPFHK